MDLNIFTARLHNAVKNIIHFTAPANQMVPVLSAAHLVIRDNRLVIEATDRYKLLQILVQDFNLHDDPNQGKDLPENTEIGIIPVESLKLIEQSFRDEARSKQEPTVTLQHHHEEGDMLTITSNTSGMSQRVRLYIDGEYPKIDGLFPNDLKPVEQHSAFNQVGVEHLQAVTKVQHARVKKTQQNVILHGSPGGKPLHVYWIAEGEVWAQGLLMPIRIPEGGEPLARYF